MHREHINEINSEKEETASSNKVRKGSDPRSARILFIGPRMTPGGVTSQSRILIRIVAWRDISHRYFCWSERMETVE